MKRRSSTGILLSAVESLHLVIVKVDALHSAYRELFMRMPRHSQSDDDRRDFNRLGSLVDETGEAITVLLDGSRSIARLTLGIAAEDRTKVPRPTNADARVGWHHFNRADR